MKRIIILLIIIIALMNPPYTFSLVDYSEYLPRWMELLKEGNDREKKIALHSLWFLQYPEYREDAGVFEPILTALKDNDPTIREAAAACLKRLGRFSKGCCTETKIIPSLIEALEDETSEVRKEVCKALSFYNDKRAVEPLIKRLQDKDPWVKVEAAFALGELRDRRAVQPLSLLLDDDSDWRYKFVQQECLMAIRKIVYSYPALTHKLMEKFNDMYLKAEIIKTFGKFRVCEARDLLLSATKDSDEQIRKLALAAISRLPVPSSESRAEFVSQQVDLLIKSLQDDPSAIVRAASAEDLGRLRDERAIEPLIQALGDDHIDVRRKAIVALCDLRHKKVFCAIANYIGSKEELRKFAADRYLKIGKLTATKKKTIRSPFGTSRELWINEEAVTALLGTIDKADVRGNIEIVRLLGFFHDDRIVTALTGMLNIALSSNTNEQLRTAYLYDELRKCATSSLGRMHNRNVVPELIHRLTDSCPKVRSAAAQSLGNFKDDRALEHLIQALQDEHQNVRRAALHSLGAYDDPRVLEKNIEMLKDESSVVRSSAAFYFMNNPDKGAVEPLIQLLDDPSMVAPRAAEALGAIGDKKAVPVLIDALHGRLNRNRNLGWDAHLRESAAKALAKIGGEECFNALVDALDTKDTQMLQTLLRALCSFEKDKVVSALRHKAGDDPQCLDLMMTIYNQHSK